MAWRNVHAEERLRKLLHIPGGLIPVLVVLAFGWTGATAIALFLLSYLILGWEAARRGRYLPLVSAAIQRTSRVGEGVPIGAIEFLIATVVLGLLFPLPYLFGSLALLGAGDGTAALVGQRWGRHALPWNSRKTWEGTAAGILVGVIAYVGFAIPGGILQTRGFAEAQGLFGSPPTWTVLPFLAVGFLVTVAGARLVVGHGWAPRFSNATTTEAWTAFGVAFVPAISFLLVAPIFLSGPILPTQGGHGALTMVLLTIAPAIAMFVESALRRHDNIIVPTVAAVLAYASVAVSGGS